MASSHPNWKRRKLFLCTKMTMRLSLVIIVRYHYCLFSIGYLKNSCTTASNPFLVITIFYFSNSMASAKTIPRNMPLLTSLMSYKTIWDTFHLRALFRLVKGLWYHTIWCPTKVCTWSSVILNLYQRYSQLFSKILVLSLCWWHELADILTLTWNLF